ncbi:AI-2E family transporter [Haloarchaeobius sp. HRN-SO-5]|uniref:AI-2E family transporter n=1 Tax=Haloarchaeobius sp. HRN-SO-5 TaxID=3446118 RepID=UPI003EBFBF25
MEANRRLVLTALVVVAGVITWFVLSAVFGTVFFALTVAAVVLPVQLLLERQGVPPYWAAVVTTVATFIGGVLVLAPLFVVVYMRREELVQLVRQLPGEFSASAFGQTYSVSISEAQDFLVTYLSDVAVQAARATPDLSLKLLLFVMVLFGFLVGQNHVYATTMGIVPARYRDAASSLHETANDTLQAIYVLQIATAVGTFAMALPTFWLLGYDYPVTMAVVAGVLQFLPVIGPSVLIGVTALFHVSQNDVNAAILVVVVGGIVVAYLPDAVIRPRLASMTADMPGSLYFVGFVGGLLSVGPVGVIIGPLVVALFAESVALLSEEVAEVPLPSDHELAGESHVFDGDGANPDSSGDDRPDPDDDGNWTARSDEDAPDGPDGDGRD